MNDLKSKMHSRDTAPDSGDIVWLDFSPSSGYEQRGRRPGLVITPLSYNQVSGLCFVLPITSKEKGYPFEVALPSELQTRGVILTDQGRTIDWSARNALVEEKVPSDTLQRVRHLLKVLFALD